MELSIIIPAYNEEKRITDTLFDYYSFFSEKLRKNFEIIIVSNNCSDNTVKKVKIFSKDKQNINLINIPYFVGKGGAVLTGFNLAKGNYIGFTDADGSIDANNFFYLYKNLKKNDGIIASRRLKGSIVLGRSYLAKISSFIFNIFVNFLFKLNFKDTQCGAKIFNKKTTKFLIKSCSQTGWIFDVDILFLCKKRKLNIVEFPITWIEKKGSKLNWKDKILSVILLIRYKLK
jgi:glycosyltransferase involved in cell wall biosynthesis